MAVEKVEVKQEIRYPEDMKNGVPSYPTHYVVVSADRGGREYYIVYGETVYFVGREVQWRRGTKIDALPKGAKKFGE